MVLLHSSRGEFVMTLSLQALVSNSFPLHVTLNTRARQKRAWNVPVGVPLHWNFAKTLSKTFCSHNFLSITYQLSSKSRKRTLRHWRLSHGKISEFQEEKEIVTFTNRAFRTKYHCVITYKQTTEGMSFLHRKNTESRRCSVFCNEVLTFP